MQYLEITLSVLVIAGLAVMGCSNNASQPSAPAGDQASSAAELREADDELSKLPPDDAASARAQKICPVSGELLGSMGPPKKVDVNGKQVWICCEGCREELLANADKHLAKLRK